MRPIVISGWTVTSALGAGRQATLSALRAGRSGLQHCNLPSVQLETWIGRVTSLEDMRLGGAFAQWDCRNNRLACLALEQDGFRDICAAACDRYGPDNVGIFVGTSTSGIEQTERAYRHRLADGRLPEWFEYDRTQDVFSVANYVRRSLGLRGPAVSVSTACSSSAKVFATAWRHMQSGLCQAAVVGGVDTLCLTTLYGFNSLQLISARPCRPADVERDGISLGEAGGFALLEWPGNGNSALQLLGFGESSDAYHMSAPHPDGIGARMAMGDALARASLAPSHVDWVHLHGTGTVANDLAEDKAVCSVFGDGMACSSTKGWTGHTLGAAGILGFAVAALAIEEGFLPRSLNTKRVDPSFAADYVCSIRNQPVNLVLINAFGFGGSNVSLLIGRIP